METISLATLVAPVLLFVMMMGMGLGLRARSFIDLGRAPSAVLVGIVGQMVILPLVGAGVAYTFQLSQSLALGVIILALCPGGVASNMITFLLKGDVALSISLTLISSCLAFLSVPILLNLVLGAYGSTAEAVSLPMTEMVLRVFLMTILPLSVGMLLARRFPRFALAVEKPLILLGFAFLMLMIVGVLLAEHQLMLEFAGRIGVALAVMMTLAMGIAYGLCHLLKLNTPKRRAITVEIGLQNSALALVIAGLLENSDIAIPAVFYSVMACVVSLIAATLGGKFNERGRTAATTTSTGMAGRAAGATCEENVAL